VLDRREYGCDRHARSKFPALDGKIPMSAKRYTRTAVVLHWLVALLVLVNVCLALSVDHLPERWVRPVIDAHKSTGITVLGLVLLRILWRAGHAPPPLPVRYAPWERLASATVHGVLYLLMLSLPLSGWMHDSAWKDAATHPMQLFGLVPWPRIGAIESVEPVAREALHTLLGTIHTALGYALYALLAVHIGAVLKHHLIDHEPELQRIWP
jgi:cytochrome b561